MLLILASYVCIVMANFSMRKSIHNYYTMVEPMGINLMDTTGALLTFFFPIYFFQYHFTAIAERNGGQRTHARLRLWRIVEGAYPKSAGTRTPSSLTMTRISALW